MASFYERLAVLNLFSRIAVIERKQVTQAQIDALTLELGQVKASLVSTQGDVTTLANATASPRWRRKRISLQGQITTLQGQLAAAGSPVDMTALQAAADDLVTTAGGVKTVRQPIPQWPA